MKQSFSCVVLPVISVTLSLDPAVAQFYLKLSQHVDKSLEQVLRDALFMLAGELSLEALQNNFQKSL